MKETGRSGCPINLTLEILGDRWSLIVLRDIMFGNRRHYRELLAKSDEGIASNILADRLKRLLDNGLISRRDDASHKQKGIYSLTEMGISLVPVFAAWGLLAVATRGRWRLRHAGLLAPLQLCIGVLIVSTLVNIPAMDLALDSAALSFGRTRQPKR